MGNPGMGNLYISTVLSQINRHFDLGESDLVAVMWSTFHRDSVYRVHEDIKEQISNMSKDYMDVADDVRAQHWRSAGDMIHVQPLDSNACWDDRGFLLRDLAIIDHATTTFINSDYHAFQMMSVLPQNQSVYDNSITGTKKQDAYDLYNDITEHMISGNNDIVNTLGWTVEFVTVEWGRPWEPADTKNLEQDRHPSALNWCEYLSASGFAVAPDILAHCKSRDHRVQHAGHVQNLPANWRYNAQSPRLVPL